MTEVTAMWDRGAASGPTLPPRAREDPVGSARDPALGAAARAAAWLETMRGPDGYGGPAVHWWQSCLRFAGAGLDWRYEGIVLGMLALFERTGDGCWLARARGACDDLVRGQLPDGRYRDSSFELNPWSGGTPHEAACDVALLRLALALRDRGDPAWEAYSAVARRNVLGFYVGRLWDAEARAFRDDPAVPSFVPNKSATLAEALFLLASLDGDDEVVVRYALPTLRHVLAHQRKGGALDGAIAQNSLRGRTVEKYFPYYVARCVGGLLEAYRWTRDERWLDATWRAIGFVLRRRLDDGSFPQVVYGNGRTNRYPRWVAGIGDVLRAARLLAPFGLRADLAATEAWLLRGQTPTGGFRTAHGFGSQISQRAPQGIPDFRDLMPCAGWADKAFRYLAERGEATPASGDLHDPPVAGVFEAPCLVRGEPAVFREDTSAIEIVRGRAVLYRWRKGSTWAEVCDPMVDIK